MVNKAWCAFETLGLQELKNVARPMEVYRVSGYGQPAAKPVMGKGAMPRERVAILPLDNISPDPADEYFADGMTEELIDRLSQVRDLRVIARTSAMGYKKKEKKASEIGRELGVDTLVEGSIRKAGSRIRITVQLIDAVTKEHLWSDRYDKELDDIFAVQTEIASRITTALANQIATPVCEHFSLRGGASSSSVRGSPDTQDMEAYTSFLHGRKPLSDKGSEETIRQALTFFETTVSRNPQLARALRCASTDSE